MLKEQMVRVSLELCHPKSQDSQLAQTERLFGGDPSTSMQVDILPESESNTIGRKSGRRIPVAIMGSANLDVVSINPRTIAR